MTIEQEPDMTQELEGLLEQAKLGAIRCSIEDILDAWSGFPVFDEEESEPANQLTLALTQHPGMELEQMIRVISELDCFSYRASCSDGRSIEFWNPLEETWRHFERRTRRTCARPRYYQSDLEYPSSDMIRAWVRRKLQPSAAPGS